MRKAIIPNESPEDPKSAAWLHLDQVASVEISSEDVQHPIEQALSAGGTGWRASVKGPQVIRLRFDQPLMVETIQIHIIEKTAERGQEVAIYAKTTSTELREIVRQQFVFSPNGSTEELETFRINLRATEILKLRIDPDRAYTPADSRHYATLASLRVG